MTDSRTSQLHTKKSIINALEYIKTLPEEQQNEAEIECRLGNLTIGGRGKRFDPDVGKGLFKRIKDALSETGFVMKYEQTTDKIYTLPDHANNGTMNVRVTSYKDDPSKWVTVIKKKVSNADHPLDVETDTAISSIRVSVSKEIPYPDFHAPIRSENTLPFVRKKKRTSFIADIFSIDISEVNVNSRITYEVEVELQGTAYVLKNMAVSDIADAFVERLQVITRIF